MTGSARVIENLIYRYAELLDLGDIDGMAKLFADAELVGPNGEVQAKGVEAVANLYHSFVKRYDNGTPNTHHVTSNVIIEFADNNTTATARSYFTVFQASDELSLQPIIAGRYHDEFVCKESVWQFSRRKMLPRLVGDMSHHQQG